jgi:hypothetical protein
VSFVPRRWHRRGIRSAARFHGHRSLLAEETAKDAARYPRSAALIVVALIVVALIAATIVSSTAVISTAAIVTAAAAAIPMPGILEARAAAMDARDVM